MAGYPSVDEDKEDGEQEGEEEEEEDCGDSEEEGPGVAGREKVNALGSISTAHLKTPLSAYRCLHRASI